MSLSTQTILFTDLESSTALTQRVGDEAAQEVLRGHNSAVRGALDANGGREVKHTGDGIMASFPSAVSAVEASLAIQRELEGSEVRVRIGINAGEPIAEDNDFFGTAVQLAARITDRAEPGQVLVSRVVMDLCAGKTFEFTSVGDATMKGFDEPIALYQVQAESSAQPPSEVPVSASAPSLHPELDLRVRTQNTTARLLDGIRGGWLYLVDVRITNREPRAVSLEATILVTLRHGDSTSRMSVPATHVPAPEIDEWVQMTRKLNELARVDQLSVPVEIGSGRTARGWIGFLLPEVMIPKRGPLNQKQPHLSEYPPDSETLVFEDTLSDQDFRIDDWRDFRAQEFEEAMKAYTAMTPKPGTAPRLQVRRSTNRGSVRFSHGQATARVTITAVDTMYADLDFSPTANVRGAIENSTTLRFERDNADGDLTVYYSLVEYQR